jgi:prepilin-type N-terminal cleavage/methylation domain-containing protein
MTIPVARVARQIDWRQDQSTMTPKSSVVNSVAPSPGLRPPSPAGRGAWGEGTAATERRSCEFTYVALFRSRKPGSSGFSLMEVLVAISLLGISYTIIFSLMTTSLKNVNRIEEREKVARYGQMKLNELVLKEQRGEEEYPLSGTFDESYGWKAEVLPYLVEQGDEEAVKVRPIRLVRIRLTVEHQSHDPRSVYSIETIGWRTKLQ